MYYFIIFAIILDRFLEIRLNLKYHLYSNTRRTKKVLMSLYIIINVIFATCLYIFSAQERPASKITKYFIIYFAPAIDTIFLIFATIVYSYIFSKLYKNKKKEEALRKQITVNKQYGPIVFKVARFSVLFCIALALVLFVIFPNILEIVKKNFHYIQNTRNIFKCFLMCCIELDLSLTQLFIYTTYTLCNTSHEDFRKTSWIK